MRGEGLRVLLEPEVNLDLVQALGKLGTYKRNYGVFNIGSGKGHSVKEVATLIQKIWGSNKKLVSLGESRNNEISVSIANVERIKQELDWIPSYSLEDGLLEMFSIMT